MPVDDAAASSTAILVCQGRALAQGRWAAGRFDDPVAADLLRPPEREQVDQARRSQPPPGWGPRMHYGLLRRTAVVMAARTVAIDDALLARPNGQLVVLGAGLDARAWRMGELADVAVFEVDHPASQRDKRARVGDRPPLARALAYVPVDFGHDDLAGALDRAGHDGTRATTWVWEGVVPYLSKDEVEATLAVVAALSAPGSRLVVNYQERSLSARAGRVVAGLLARVGGSRSPWSGEPWRSTWTPRQLAHLLSGTGFRVVHDVDLSAVAARLGMRTRSRSLRNGRVLVADR